MRNSCERQRWPAKYTIYESLKHMIKSIGSVLIRVLHRGHICIHWTLVHLRSEASRWISESDSEASLAAVWSTKADFFAEVADWDTRTNLWSELTPPFPVVCFLDWSDPFIKVSRKRFGGRAFRFRPIDASMKVPVVVVLFRNELLHLSYWLSWGNVGIVSSKYIDALCSAQSPIYWRLNARLKSIFINCIRLLLLQFSLSASGALNWIRMPFTRWNWQRKICR